MKAVALYAHLASLLPFSLVLSQAARAQTVCGTEHSQPGVFICYPNPGENAGDAGVKGVFHLSAQGNAPAGHTIRRYVVLVDGHPVYQNRLTIPTERLSIETNVKSPFSSGSHALGLLVDGAGSAEIPALAFHPATSLGFCDPFSRVEARSCLTSNTRGPLVWSAAGGGTSNTDPFAGYLDYVALYGQNLKSVEADVADAAAVDAQGTLYMAAHSSADVELRKYTSNGSLTYDYLVRSCGSGFLSITSIAVDNAGRVWLAGNTTACLQTTPNAFEGRIGDSVVPHGFVMLIDTSKSGTSTPVYVTYLSGVENSINAIRVDGAGNAYVAGTAASAEFPHESIFRVDDAARNAPGTRIGFISVLNSSGSELRWSTLLQGAELNALAIDGAGGVYVTGRETSKRAGDDALVAAVSDNGRRLSYAARFGGSGSEEGRAISISADGTWVFVTGSTNSLDFPADLAAKAVRGQGPSPFAVALQPCRTGLVYSRILAGPLIADSPEVAVRPALDAFSENSPVKEWRNRTRPFASIQAAQNCPLPTP